MVTLPLFETTFEPRSLVVYPPMTDAELEEMCLRNEMVQIERTSDGVIRLKPLGGGVDELRQFRDSFPTRRLVASPPSRAILRFMRGFLSGGWIAIKSGCGLCFARAIEGVDEGRSCEDAAALSGVCSGVAFAVG